MAQGSKLNLLVIGLFLGTLLSTEVAGQALLGPGFLPVSATLTNPSNVVRVSAAVVSRANIALLLKRTQIPGIRVEGLLPAQTDTVANERAFGVLRAMSDLSLAWRMTADRAYLEKADDLLGRWADSYPLTFNPIDETRLEPFFVAYDLTRDDLSQATRAKVDGFLRRLALGYLDGMESGKVRPNTGTNNWQSHRVKLATLAAFDLNDAALIARANAAFERQVAANLRPDGSNMDFAMRDALHYVVYSVEPLLTAALAAQRNGQDWYGFKSPDGTGLANTLSWLSTYARGEKSHVEYLNSVVPFDRARTVAGVSGFANAPWQPSEAVQVFALASLLDPRFAGLRDTLLTAGKSDVPPWLLLAVATAPAKPVEPPVSVSGIGFRVADLDRASRFFIEGLGMRKLGAFSTADFDEIVLGFAAAPNSPPIFLLRRRDGKPDALAGAGGRGDKIILGVRDIATIRAGLVRSGYAAEAIKQDAKSGVQQMWVAAPDGQRLEIVQR